MEIRELGGDKAAHEERIYFKSVEFELGSQLVRVTRSKIQDIDMNDLFARHMARYYQVGLFCRPGYRVLDFPCGSGYGSEILSPFMVEYEGLEFDLSTIVYARKAYASSSVKFDHGDLRDPRVAYEAYNVIACIEGLEHIAMQHHNHLLATLQAALKPGGVLVISSPENPSGRSGQSGHNPHHRGELTKKDFVALLHRHFPSNQVELVTNRARLSSRVTTTCFYGICHKEP